MWQFKGGKRPSFAAEPGPDQESVWDYPRPPAVIADTRRILIRSDAATLATSNRAVRICETASPPTFYLPPADVDVSRLVGVSGSSFCEWKGSASYWALESDDLRHPIAWSYEDPLPRYAMIRSCLAFYPGRIDCFVDDERVRPQPGGFYGGWITNEIVGPFKGDPDTGHW